MTFLLLLKKYWAQILTGIGIIILLTVIAGLYQNCKPQPKIDQQSIQKINNGNELEKKEEVKKVIEENADKINSTRENTKLTDLAIEERDKQVKEKVDQVNKEIDKIHREQGRDITSEELEELLTGKK